MEQIRNVFVYGTLKQGQVRERAWPHAPRQIRTATTRGRLFDLGDYPALLAGDDVVSGELWEFEAEQMEATMAVLDEIEDYYDRPDDLYRREVVQCTTETGVTVLAFAYRYLDESLPEIARISPRDGVCSWPTLRHDA